MPPPTTTTTESEKIPTVVAYESTGVYETPEPVSKFLIGNRTPEPLVADGDINPNTIVALTIQQIKQIKFIAHIKM